MNSYNGLWFSRIKGIAVLFFLVLIGLGIFNLLPIAPTDFAAPGPVRAAPVLASTTIPQSERPSPIEINFARLPLRVQPLTTSEGVNMPWSVLSGGGAPVSAGEFSLKSTLGQPSAIGCSTQAESRLCAGFWYGVFASLTPTSCDTVTEIPQAECEALVALYNSTDGANWSNNTGWLNTNTPCDWYGVLTCSMGHVTMLDLYGNQLSGSIPPELSDLTNLQYLILGDNELSGSIPPDLGNLANLHSLNLYSNQLSGSIPPELGNLTNLEHLYLTSNQLSGNIPPELGSLTNLQGLALPDNKLSGSIPPELGNLSNLQSLLLHNNQLSGSIPTQLGSLTNLTRLYLYNNSQLSGALPHSLTSLTQLDYFYFYNTDLCEPDDAEFQAWLASVSNLQSTGVSCCALFGDLDGDGDVDIGDIIQVASRWRTSCDNPDPDNNVNTPNYEARYDLDGDCDIDVVDIMLVVAHWGERCYRMHGLDLSPYIDDDEDPDNGGDQITDEELEERMEVIAPYTEWIRTFGCNDDLKEAGMFAHDMGLKAAIGAWLGPESTPQGLEENQNQIACLCEQAIAGHVDIAIVGSEVLLRGDFGDPTEAEDKLTDYINQVKQCLQTAGIDIPVTYADVYGVLLDARYSGVMSAVDLAFVNYYPYWEGRKIDYAVAYVHRWHQQVMDAAGGKEVVVSETGWPSCGDQIGDAVPSPENASFYFLNFVSWARANDVKYFYFESFDESWKAKHEGPQGACWGTWDKQGDLKPGMQRVLNGETVDDNWSEPIPEAPIIDFLTLPELTETNIQNFVVAGSTEPDNEVWLNGTLLPPDAMDGEGNFAVAVPLVEGDNPLELIIKSGEEVIATAEKTVRFDEDFSTGGKRLIYVDSVSPGEGVPALPGTIVIDLDNDTLLGLIEDKHVTGISPDGSEIYTSDRTVISTNTHRELRSLPFTQDILSNGFIVSPDGTHLYSRNERLDLPSNTLLENLPINIVTGSSWAGAPIPGGPTISADGRYVYCCNDVRIIDTEDNTVVGPSIGGLYMSDIALTPDESKVLVSEYSYASGRLDVYAANTFESLATISGLGDFAGEIVFSKDGQRAVVGSAGSPASAANGRVTVIDLDKLEKSSQTTVPLADNLVTSGNNEFFVSSGESGLFNRLGIDVYVLDPSGNLVRTKNFFLGINGFKQSTGKPKNDQIRKIVFKP